MPLLTHSIQINNQFGEVELEGTSTARCLAAWFGDEDMLEETVEKFRDIPLNFELLVKSSNGGSAIIRRFAFSAEELTNG